MTEIISRLMEMGKIGPEIAIQLMGMIVDGVGTGTEWTGENLDQLGELTQQLADKIRGVKEAQGK